LRGFGLALVKELHQDVHDELHRRVVVVVEDHLVAARAFGRRPIGHGEAFVPLRVLLGANAFFRRHGGRSRILPCVAKMSRAPLRVAHGAAPLERAHGLCRERAGAQRLPRRSFSQTLSASTASAKFTTTATAPSISEPPDDSSSKLPIPPAALPGRGGGAARRWPSSSLRARTNPPSATKASTRGSSPGSNQIPCCVQTSTITPLVLPKFRRCISTWQTGQGR